MIVSVDVSCGTCPAVRVLRFGGELSIHILSKTKRAGEHKNLVYLTYQLFQQNRHIHQ